MKKLLPVLGLLLFAPTVARAQDKLLLQKPTVNATSIVFAYADDLWTVPRNGGEAQRLTSGPGLETDPIFSPDGTQLAFTGEYEGNVDVYVMPASGGQPKRLTYHPGSDRAVGWTPDGKRVLFASGRNSYSRFGRLFTIPALGGPAEELPLPMADQGVYSPDGKELAYVPLGLQTYAAWKRYRGGTTSAIWIADLADSKITRIPRENSNDTYPMWIKDSVYFLSDRNGPTTLFCYDLKGAKVRQVIKNNGIDFKSASAGPDCIVYEQFGSIHLLDLPSEKPHKVDIRINADMPGLRPHFVKVGKQISGASLSPTGVRAVFEARGEILTVPAKKGDVRNLTNTPGSAERDPAWSPDGKWIAYFSDASGEYELHLRDQSSLGDVKKFKLGEAPAFYYSPHWSPDGKKIAYTDNRNKLWYLDLDSGKNELVATNYYLDRGFDPSWSPDSQWLAYTKVLKNHLHAVYFLSLKDGTSHQITDGMSDAHDPCFDRSGKYLYFTASTDAGPAMGGIEMSNYNYPITRSVYLAVLSKDLPSPLSPESDEEKGAAKKPMPVKPAGGDEKPKPAPAMKIDLKDIGQRIIALPLPARNYVDLFPGKAGTIFLLEASQKPVTAGPGLPFGKLTLTKFELDKRRAEPFTEVAGRATISHDGEKLLYKSLGGWHLVSTAAAPKPGEGVMKLDDIEVRVDPRAEWKQLYRETWRIERDFLYDPNFHGYDLKTAEKHFEPYLEQVASRRDLNYLFMQMLSELSLGHVYVRGGDIAEAKAVKGGLLGADYAIKDGRYRFAKVYRGENWNPDLRAPLTQPGVNVQSGDFLLAVNGQDVKPPESVYRYFEGTAGKSVVLRVGPSADGKGARDVTVVPIESELALRNRAWIEANRRKVDEMTKGRVAYVYLPDTAAGGYTNFNRYFFAQVDKPAVIIDERFNGGGKAADYVIERLKRPISNYWSTRHGADYSTPAGAIFGPKVMMINEQAGSGGDYLPWAFRRNKLGPIVGKRTWGGLVGIGGYPPLIDGGMVTAPHFAFWTPEGEWEVENRGVPPDIEVEYDPMLVRKGQDPQLEKAVQLALEALEKNPPTQPKRPPYPNYHKNPALQINTKPAGESSSPRGLQPAPPTPKQPISEVLHGEKITDDYRWLEKAGDPVVRKWLDAQNEHTAAYFAKSPSLAPIRERLKDVLAAPGPSFYAVQSAGGELFALRRVPGKQQPLLVTFKPVDPESARTIVDPDAINAKGKTAIDIYFPSRDGKLVAVSLSENGSEQGTLYVFDVATGKKLSDAIPRASLATAGGSVAWDHDGQGFHYTRYPRGKERPNGDLDFYQQIFHHKLGTPDSEDTYVLGKNFPRIAEIFLDASDDGQWLLATVQKGDGGEFMHHLRGPDGKWRQITDYTDQVNAIAFGKGKDQALYALTRQRAPRGRIVRLPLGSIDLGKAEVVVPESDAAIAGLAWRQMRMVPAHVPTERGLYVLEINGGPSRLRYFPHGNSSYVEVPLPPVSSVSEVVPIGGGEALLRIESYTKPAGWYRWKYDANTSRVPQPQPTALSQDAKTGMEDMQITRVSATSRDGTKVPMTIIHRTGIKLDGNNPTLLYAYGGYGMSLSPSFNARRLPWLEQGGVLVIANLRGGGEYGDAWHKAAILTKRQNAYDDFYACAKFLVDTRYTRPDKLAIEGASNGGLLMGVALTQHPEMYRAVVASVGIYDMLRFEQHPNGVFNTTEYGTVKDPTHFKALHAYSPLHNVRDGTAYPAVLLTTGANDGRVDPSNSYKMAARLQAATTSGRPVLLHVGFDSGHGIGENLDAGIERAAEAYAFLFDQLGMRYQAKKQ